MRVCNKLQNRYFTLPLDVTECNCPSQLFKHTSCEYDLSKHLTKVQLKFSKKIPLTTLTKWLDAVNTFAHFNAVLELHTFVIIYDQLDHFKREQANPSRNAISVQFQDRQAWKFCQIMQGVPLLSRNERFGQHQSKACLNSFFFVELITFQALRHTESLQSFVH